MLVDDKLKETLEKRFNDSFKLISDRLEQVHKGLGEMQTLATGVGDLKKVLSNVKTRGIMGELQLGAILEQILSPSQYASTVVTKKGSQNFVVYEILLPGDEVAGSLGCYSPLRNTDRIRQRGIFQLLQEMAAKIVPHPLLR